MASIPLRRFVIGLAPVLAVAVLGSACGGGRRYRPVFGWASVPACQAAIRSRAFSEFGSRAKVVFEEPAEEEHIARGRIRVTGVATLERKKKDDLPLEYECVTNPKQSRLISARYGVPN